MDSARVSQKIESLVDHLRSHPEDAVGLGDIASVTEVLLATMRRYFNTVDTEIYVELRRLSDYIADARAEISAMRPEDLKRERLPRAGLELEAIVQATEAATGQIMDAAEGLMGSAATDVDAYRDEVMDACTRIFEACSFQDITGQRITKVVETLTFIEQRLSGLQKAWGPGCVDAPPDPEAVAGDAALLNGPALAGEGMQQDGVDEMFESTGMGERSGKSDQNAIDAMFN